MSKVVNSIKDFLISEEEVPKPVLSPEDFTRRKRHVRKTLTRISYNYEGGPIPRSSSVVFINEEENTILVYHP